VQLTRDFGVSPASIDRVKTILDEGTPEQIEARRVRGLAYAQSMRCQIEAGRTMGIKKETTPFMLALQQCPI